MFEWLGFTFRNLSMPELWLCTSRENFSFDSDRYYGDASNPKLHWVNYAARGALGHTGSINSTWACMKADYGYKFSQNTLFYAPTAKTKSKQIRSLVFSLCPSIPSQGDLCWTTSSLRVQSPGGTGFMQESHFQLPTRQGPKVWSPGAS